MGSREWTSIGGVSASFIFNMRVHTPPYTALLQPSVINVLRNLPIITFNLIWHEFEMSSLVLKAGKCKASQNIAQS